jgi:hypothetical protein
MGIMKDIRDLSQLGKQASEGWDPAEQMRAATSRMQQAAAQSRLLASGTAARATVVALRDTGTVLDYMPVVDIDVLVMPTDGVPWPATAVNVGHANLAVLRPGVAVTVRYDPAEPSAVAIV